MRTLISTAFISLDGVVEDPGGQTDYRNGGWTFKSVEFVPEAYALKGSEQEESTAMLMGRRSYQLFSPVWPGMDDFAHYKDLPKYVVSTTMTEDDLVSDWGPTTILRSLDEVAAAQGVGGWPDHHPRQRHPQPRPGRRRAGRPLPPPGVPAPPRRRREAVRRHRQGHPEAQARGQRSVQQRHPEEHPRRRPLRAEPGCAPAHRTTRGDHGRRGGAVGHSRQGTAS